MRWLALVFVLGCTSNSDGTPKPSLEGPYSCGPSTCSTGQICITESAGSQCQVNADAGVGPYDTYSWRCVDLPMQCDGVPTCDCVGAGGFCLGISGDGREVDFGCI